MGGGARRAHQATGARRLLPSSPGSAISGAPGRPSQVHRPLPGGQPLTVQREGGAHAQEQGAAVVVGGALQDRGQRHGLQGPPGHGCGGLPAEATEDDVPWAAERTVTATGSPAPGGSFAGGQAGGRAGVIISTGKRRFHGREHSLLVKPQGHRRNPQGDVTDPRVYALGSRAPRPCRNYREGQTCPRGRLETSRPSLENEQTQTRKIATPETRSASPTRATLPHTPRGARIHTPCVRGERASRWTAPAHRGLDTLKVVRSHRPSSLPEMSSSRTSIKYFWKISSMFVERSTHF